MKKKSLSRPSKSIPKPIFEFVYNANSSSVEGKGNLDPI